MFSAKNIKWRGWFWGWLQKMQVDSGFLYNDKFFFRFFCKTLALKLSSWTASITDRDLSALIPKSFKVAVLLTPDIVCWVTSKPTTGEIAPTVLNAFDLLRSFTIIDSSPSLKPEFKTWVSRTSLLFCTIALLCDVNAFSSTFF